VTGGLTDGQVETLSPGAGPDARRDYERAFAASYGATAEDVTEWDRRASAAHDAALAAERAAVKAIRALRGAS
jgi:hypothetical protein